MNELLHELINKFNNISVMCGGLALVLESQSQNGQLKINLREKVAELHHSIIENLDASRRLLDEIEEITYEKLKIVLNIFSEAYKDETLS